MKKKILATMMIIGFTASISGLTGSHATLKDFETSTSNLFQSGAIDLKIDWNESYNGENIENQSLTDNPGPIFNVTEIQPGDQGEATISFHVFDNPGWIWFRANQTGNFENGTDNTAGEGELGQNLRFTLWYDDGDNLMQEDEQMIFNGTAHELGEFDIGDGLLLDGDRDETGIQPFQNSTTRYIGFRWRLPEDTGCEVQTDSKTFDLEFHVKQARHNQNPVLDSMLYFSDTEESSNNTFSAGNFEKCPEEEEEPGKCGPIVAPEEGKYTAKRITNGNISDVDYTVENTSINSVKFEEAKVGLGEDGVVQSDIFNITVKGETNETVYVRTKAGQFEGNATLTGEGDTLIDSSGLWTIELLKIREDGNETTFTIRVTSDGAEGQNSPALSFIEFRFCTPFEDVNGPPGKAGNS